MGLGQRCTNVCRGAGHEIRVIVYFIYTETFASNFAVWKSVSDFTSTNQRGETSFSHVKKSFRPITNHALIELCFRGLFRGHRGHYSTALRSDKLNFIGLPIWNLLISLFSN